MRQTCSWACQGVVNGAIWIYDVYSGVRRWFRL
jgi:hypothetical protein